MKFLHAYLFCSLLVCAISANATKVEASDEWTPVEQNDDEPVPSRWQQFKEMVVKHRGKLALIASAAIGGFAVKKLWWDSRTPEPPPGPKPKSGPKPKKKLTTEELLAQQNPEKVAKKYEAPTEYDGRIYEGGIESGSPTNETIVHEFRNAVTQNILINNRGEKIGEETVELGPIRIIQVPGLYQGLNPLDHTNYCGYYALYNASILASLPPLEGNLPDKTSFNNRAGFLPFFRLALKRVAAHRNKNPDSVRGDYIQDPETNIPGISFLSETEMEELQRQGDELAIDLSQVNLGGVFHDLPFSPRVQALALFDAPRVLAHQHSGAENVDPAVYVVSTKPDPPTASHWIAMRFEKSNGLAIVTFVDSLCMDRRFMFDNVIKEKE